MAKGYPDWFGFALFPKYGAATRVNVLGTAIVPVSDLDVIAVLGKGQIFGGWLRIATDCDPALIALQSTLDGVVFDQTLVSSMLNIYPMMQHRTNPLTLTYFNEIDLSYVFAIDFDWTFELSFTINVELRGGTIGACEGEFFFYRII